MGLNYQAAVNISAEYTGQRAVDAARADFAKFDGSIKGTVSGLGGLKASLGTLAAAFAIREVAQYAKSIIDLGDTLNDLRQKTGISVKSLSDLKAAAEDGGVDFDSLSGALKKFSLTLAKADAGVDVSQSGFKALGISLKDSFDQFKSSDKLLLEIADKFENLKDGPEKAAVAVALFGKQGADLIPVLNGGRKSIENMGIQMSEDFVHQSDVFNDELNKMSRNAKGFGVSILEFILPAMNSLISKFNELASSMTLVANPNGNPFIESLKDTVKAFKTVLIDFPSSALSNVLGSGTAGASPADRLKPENYGPPKGKTGKVDTSFLNGEETKKIQDGVKAIENRIKKIQAETLAEGASNTSKLIAIELADLEAKGISKSSAEYQRLASSLKDAVDAREINKARKAGDDFLRKQQDEVELQKIELNQVNYSTESYRKLVAAKKDELAIREATKNMTEEETQAYRESADAVSDLHQQLIEQQEAQKYSFGQGAKEAFRDYIESARDVASQTKSLFSNVFSGMEDAIVKFVQTGKLSFEDLAKQIEADLIRIAIRQAVVFGINALVGGFSGGGTAIAGQSGGGTAYAANGGIIGSQGHVPLSKYARGGIATSPQLAVFGEGSTPEAFVPLPDGRSIPVNMKGGGNGTSVVVNVNVVNGTEQTSNTKADSDNGRQLGRMISAAVTEEIVKQKRPGGLLS